MRVAALEDNVAFLEHWCEEQQDVLDRSAGPVAYDYEREPDPRNALRVVDLRESLDDEDDDAADADTIVAIVDTEHDRRVRLIQERLNRLRRRLALTVAPPIDTPPARPSGRRVSARPASRTAP